MAKGAAKEEALGGMHSLLARVFTKTLEKYERQLDAVGRDEIESDLVDEMMKEFEPNPAMLSAIAKFLKDNDIGMDSDEVDALNATERRLSESRERRKKAGLNLSIVPHVEAV